jgi:hypothetical protein
MQKIKELLEEKSKINPEMTLDEATYKCEHICQCFNKFLDFVNKFGTLKQFRKLNDAFKIMLDKLVFKFNNDKNLNDKDAPLFK